MRRIESRGGPDDRNLDWRLARATSRPILFINSKPCQRVGRLVRSRTKNSTPPESELGFQSQPKIEVSLPQRTCHYFLSKTSFQALYELLMSSGRVPSKPGRYSQKRLEERRQKNHYQTHTVSRSLKQVQGQA